MSLYPTFGEFVKKYKIGFNKDKYKKKVHYSEFCEICWLPVYFGSNTTDAKLRHQENFHPNIKFRSLNFELSLNFPIVKVLENPVKCFFEGINNDDIEQAIEKRLNKTLIQSDHEKQNLELIKSLNQPNKFQQLITINLLFAKKNYAKTLPVKKQKKLQLSSSKDQQFSKFIQNKRQPLKGETEYDPIFNEYSVYQMQEKNFKEQKIEEDINMLKNQEIDYFKSSLIKIRQAVRNKICNISFSNMLALEQYLLILQNSDIRTYRKLKQIQIEIATDYAIENTFKEVLTMYKTDFDEREKDKQSQFSKANQKDQQLYKDLLKLFEFQSKSQDEISKFTNQKQIKELKEKNQQNEKTLKKINKNKININSTFIYLFEDLIDQSYETAFNRIQKIFEETEQIIIEKNNSIDEIEQKIKLKKRDLKAQQKQVQPSNQQIKQINKQKSQRENFKKLKDKIKNIKKENQIEQNQESLLQSEESSYKSDSNISSGQNNQIIMAKIENQGCNDIEYDIAVQSQKDLLNRKQYKKQDFKQILIDKIMLDQIRDFMFKGNSSMAILFGVNDTNGHQLVLAASIIALDDFQIINKDNFYNFKIDKKHQFINQFLMKDFDEIGVIYNVGNQQIDKQQLKEWFGNKIIIGYDDILRNNNQSEFFQGLNDDEILDQDIEEDLDKQAFLTFYFSNDLSEQNKYEDYQNKCYFNQKNDKQKIFKDKGIPQFLNIENLEYFIVNLNIDEIHFIDKHNQTQQKVDFNTIHVYLKDIIDKNQDLDDTQLKKFDEYANESEKFQNKNQKKKKSIQNKYFQSEIENPFPAWSDEFQKYKNLSIGLLSENQNKFGEKLKEFGNVINFDNEIHTEQIQQKKIDLFEKYKQFKNKTPVYQIKKNNKNDFQEEEQVEKIKSKSKESSYLKSVQKDSGQNQQLSKVSSPYNKSYYYTDRKYLPSGNSQDHYNQSRKQSAKCSTTKIIKKESAAKILTRSKSIQKNLNLNFQRNNQQSSESESSISSLQKQSRKQISIQKQDSQKPKKLKERQDYEEAERNKDENIQKFTDNMTIEQTFNFQDALFPKKKQYRKSRNSSGIKSKK